MSLNKKNQSRSRYTQAGKKTDELRGSAKLMRPTFTGENTPILLLRKCMEFTEQEWQITIPRSVCYSQSFTVVLFLCFHASLSFLESLVISQASTNRRLPWTCPTTYSPTAFVTSNHINTSSFGDTFIFNNIFFEETNALFESVYVSYF